MENLKEKVAEVIKNNSPISLPKVSKILGVHKGKVEKVAKELDSDMQITYHGGRMWKWIGE